MALKTVKSEPGKADPVTPPVVPPVTSTETAAPAAAGAGKSGLRKKILIGVAAVVAVGLVWMGGDWLLNGRYLISTENAQVRSDIARVAAKVEGYVTKVHVVENQQVKAGDLLVELESADFGTRVAQAKAELAQAEADAAQAGARIAAQRDQLAEAQAAREAASASADLSASELKRLAELADKGWYPKAKVEQAEAARRTSGAQLVQADASVTAQRSQLTSTQAGAQSAAARVEAARAKLAAAELDFSRTQITAPIDGVVTNKEVIEGQLLSPGRQAMAIVAGQQMWVIANFKETQIAEMKAGQCAKIHVDAYPNLHVKGHVDSLAPSTGATFSLVPQDTATGNFTKIVQRVPVKIVLEPDSIAAGLLRAGLQVTATVSTKPDCE
jgi:membrane fusion protein (multidrug efflux system)